MQQDSREKNLYYGYEECDTCMTAQHRAQITTRCNRTATEPRARVEAQEDRSNNQLKSYERPTHAVLRCGQAHTFWYNYIPTMTQYRDTRQTALHLLTDLL